MDNVNKTLYIPLFGKAYVSKKSIILNDKRAEYIWEQEGFELKGKSKSKWLAYYMGMRSAVFDDWLRKQMSDSKLLEDHTGLFFVKEHEMTPDFLINELKGIEKFAFKKLFAGKLSKKMYRLYEYQSR